MLANVKVVNITVSQPNAAPTAPTNGTPSIEPSKVPGEGTLIPDPAFKSPPPCDSFGISAALVCEGSAELVIPAGSGCGNGAVCDGPGPDM